MTGEETEGVQAKCELSGHVHSKSGAMLSGAKVACDGFETITLADGFYIFKGMISGTFEVSANLQSFQPGKKEVTITDNNAAVVDFQLSPMIGTAKISGCVYDNESSEPLMNGGSVILILPISNRYVDIDANGHYEFVDLPAGTYKIFTSVQEFEDCEAVLDIADGESKNYDFHLKIRREVEAPMG